MSPHAHGGALLCHRVPRWILQNAYPLLNLISYRPSVPNKIFRLRYECRGCSDSSRGYIYLNRVARIHFMILLLSASFKQRARQPFGWVTIVKCLICSLFSRRMTSTQSGAVSKNDICQEERETMSQGHTQSMTTLKEEEEREYANKEFFFVLWVICCRHTYIATRAIDLVWPKYYVCEYASRGWQHGFPGGAVWYAYE